MRILLSNDDGVHALGIKVLAECLSQIAEVFIVAPLNEKSTTGHTLTLDHPLRISKIAKNVYGCSGFPADCVLMGVAGVLKNINFDLVVSGINRGANLGQDTYYSGTVAAAREATFHNHKAIAVSTVTDFTRPKEHIHYFSAGEFVASAIKNGIHKDIPKNSLLNINVPDLPIEKIKGTKVTHLGLRKYSEMVDERIDCRNRPYYWIAGSYMGFEDDEGSDCLAVDQGHISITPIKLQNTNSDMGEAWENKVKNLKLV